MPEQRAPSSPEQRRAAIIGRRGLSMRRLRREDFDALVALQLRCFPGMTPWTRAQIDSQLSIFPEGQLGIFYKRQLIASSSSLIVNFANHSQWHNWAEIADKGFIRNHDDHGDTLYGIEIMVDPRYRGMKLSRRLYDARKAIAVRRNLRRIIIGGRISGYGRHAHRMSAREYVQKVIEKTLVDPVLTPQLANGFVLKEIIPDYFPSDSESRGYATFLEWSNLDYRPRGERRFTVPSYPVRVCATQYEMRKIKDFKEFSQQCEFFVDVASDNKADFVVFPELFTTQLFSFMKPDRPGLAARRLAGMTPQYVKLFTRLALKFNINIVAGSQFTMAGENLRNTAFLFRRNGSVAHQDKLHITPNERRWWGVSPGERLHVFDTDRGRIAVLVCYDAEFPELGRIAAEKGAQILFVPFNTDERHSYLRVRHCTQARCIENHLYAVLSGCVGNLPAVENADLHYAQSAILSPSDLSFGRDGVVAECMPNIETVVMHDVDLDLLRRQRLFGTVQNWADRRGDLYRIEYQEGRSRRRI